MATLSIQRRFAVDASVEDVWAYLTKPALLVGCLPGAALTSSSEDGLSHEGTVTVKLGAMSVSYAGTATFEEVDAAAHRLRVRAKAREKTGAGAAEMTVTVEVGTQASGSVEVSLDASASVSGKIVTLGRGMIDIVSEQVLSDFAACLSSTLSAESAAGAGGADADSGAPASPAAAAPVNPLGLLWRAFRAWLGRLLGRG